MDDIKIFMIGNAHIDPVWLWRWNEGFWVVRHTIRNVLKLMRKHKNFTFIFSSALMYKWLEESEPELFEELKRLVKEGRWIIVGGWWVEPDCNLPSGESFVRQALYGQKYFMNKFGRKANVGYNIDSFGHCASLPQILKKSGLSFYIFMRPGPHEKKLPSDLFWWEGIDGSKVLAYRIPLPYVATGENIIKHVKRIIARLSPGIRHAICLYGAGDHGGGPSEEDLSIIEDLESKLKNVKLVFSSPSSFFKEVLESYRTIPVVKDELQHHASGCYSVNSEVKKLNRKAEHLLLAAERLSVLSNILTNMKYPKDSLRRAWELILFCQFHDSLAGTCIPEAYEDIKNMYSEAIYRAEEAMNLATQRIASRIDTSQSKLSLIVFNPTFFKLKVPIEVEPAWGEEYTIVNEDGEAVPSQEVQASSLSGRRRILFIAELPPLGYRTYSIVKEKIPSKKSILRAKNTSLENEFFIIKIDEVTGYIRSLIDKRYGVTVFKDASAVPIVIDDKSDTWSHGVFKFDKEVGKFKAFEVKVLEKGPVRATIRIKSRYGSSELWQDLMLYSNLDYIEVRSRVFWYEKHKMLKLSFPINVENPTVTYEIPYGVITRKANGEEEPGQRWVDITGITRSSQGKELMYGVTLINDSKYSFSAVNSELRMTVLRSPIYAHHIPHTPRPNVDYRYIDIGEHEFRYILYPHIGDWRQNTTYALAEFLNTRLTYIIEDQHKGILPRIFSLVNYNTDNIVVNVLKWAEDYDGLIMRCYEAFGKEADARIKIETLKRELCFKVKPFEIKSFIIPLDIREPIRECNLLEEAQEES